MKKKILLIVLCVVGIVGALYLQVGRKAVINNVLTETTPQGYELTMSITANKLFIVNRESFAETLVQQVMDNDFENMKMSYDVHGYPDELTITVYVNEVAKCLNLPAFKFKYFPGSRKGEFIFDAK